MKLNHKKITPEQQLAIIDVSVSDVSRLRTIWDGSACTQNVFARGLAAYKESRDATANVDTEK